MGVSIEFDFKRTKRPGQLGRIEGIGVARWGRIEGIGEGNGDGGGGWGNGDGCGRLGMGPVKGWWWQMGREKELGMGCWGVE